MATEKELTGDVASYPQRPVRHFRGLRTGIGSACGDSAATVLDIVDDLCELRHLISDLEDLPGTSENETDRLNHDASESWLRAHFGNRLASLKSKHRRGLDLVERASRWATGKELSDVLSAVRREYLDVKSALRAAYRHRGTILCAHDWQSPTYAATVNLGVNRLCEGVGEHSWDYKRDGHLDALVYERRFVEEYASHLGSKSLKAYLANSGMAAFATVVHWLAHEQRLPGAVAAFQPMYFENIHLLRGFFPNLLQLEARSSAEILEGLRRTRPSLILCDAVTNCGEVLYHDIESILKWADREAKGDVVVVVDTTCLPTVLLRPGLLAELGGHVRVILVESLAKYHQFGMDVVTGGVVMLHGEDPCQESFRKTRARLGTNIADASVGSLPQPGRERLTRRMHRHSRNVHILASELERRSQQRCGVIQSLSWLRDGTFAAPWYRGSCFSIRLKEAFRSIQHYREFENVVVDLARQRSFAIALSTSFGFDVSRLYVTAPATVFEPPFLRVSVGTETREEIDTLLEILTGADAELGRRWQGGDRPAAAPVDCSGFTAVQALAAEREARATTVAASVYVGENALRDYLNPANYAPTPLVELPGDLNPLREQGIRLFAKMMPLVPLMNIKSLPAFSMLNRAAERGELYHVQRIIESSSSNTVLSLSVMARLFGIETSYAIVDHSIAPALLRMLRLFGIEVLMHPGPGHELFGKMEPRSERAKTLGSQPGWLNPGQYTNPDNPEGFARWLAPDLWEQTRGRLSFLSCGLGTCGTMVGVARALREQKPSLKVLACYPPAGQAIPGPRERSLLSDVAFPWQTAADAFLEVEAEEGFAASVRLLRRGIMGGPSSGMNYAGALRFLKQESAAGRLRAMVEAEGELWCVFLCCDSPLPHVDEYFEILGDKYFPSVHPVSYPQEAGQAPALVGSHIQPKLHVYAN